MWNILILGKIHAAGTDRLREAGSFWLIERPDNAPDTAPSSPETADAIIVRTTRIDRGLS